MHSDELHPSPGNVEEVICETSVTFTVAVALKQASCCMTEAYMLPIRLYQTAMVDVLRVLVSLT
jgi:alpha-D-ribose 1-methylphosphonate 5-triphosphate synthase subunit PhnI